MAQSPFEACDQAVERARPTIERLADELWQLAELSLQEVKSARLLMSVLQEEGFTITSKGTAGVPTAFIAEWGTGKPILGVLAEYDALPGLGNEPVPYREARKDHIASGHGCGHNLLGSAAIGATLVLKNLMVEQHIAGTLRLYGCAAEETEGAKVYMARAGLFDDLDAALHWHPGAEARVSNYRTAAVNTIRIEFFGKAAHAGGTPWLGRSALHAAELCSHGINLMREHIEPTARIHYVVESGGEAPNVVPDYTRIRLYVRDIDRAHVEASTAWLQQIAEGVALATQTRTKALVYSGLYDLLPNQPLAERMQTHLERVGIPAYTAEEMAFAQEIQRNYGVEPRGMATSTEPLSPDTLTFGFSTDVADVSWNTPTMGCGMPTMPLGVSVHTWAATACHGMSIGLKGAINAARVLAATGLDILTDPDLRQAARADFQRRTRGKPYVSPLGPEMTRPLELPDWVLQEAGS
ncbi:MAG TPA: amidohydrolase [Ktedonobacteraceae bacterium]|nr:amidohydrolase [Ktedonobacteraceae bacterium]